MLADTPGDTRAHRVLIVEDDAAIAAGLALNFRIEGYLSEVVADGESALAALREGPFDLVLLDITLPRVNGLEVLARMREFTRVPVIVVSARQDEYDKVAALRLGADDYVTKPFGLAELLARVHAVLRRSSAQKPAPSSRALRFGEVTLDVDMRTVERAGEEVKLTHLEFELLAYLAQNPARVFSREQLLERVWGYRGSPRTVDNFIAQLRAKLEVDPERPRHLTTVRGTGYRFDP